MMKDNDSYEAAEDGVLTLEESNNARLQALNSIGVGINGINEALIMRCLERLLGPVASEQVKREHNEWLADQLTTAEEQVNTMQRRQALTLPGKGRR